MSFIGALLSEPDTVVAECRRCGTTVEPGTTDCTACGSGDIVQYTI